MSTVTTLASPYSATTDIPAIACNRTLTVAALVAADLAAVLFAGCVAVSLRFIFHGHFSPAAYATLLPALPLFFFGFLCSRSLPRHRGKLH